MTWDLVTLQIPIQKIRCRTRNQTLGNGELQRGWHAAAHGIAKASYTSGQLNKNDNLKSTVLISSPLMSNSSPKQMMLVHRPHFVCSEHLDFHFQQFGKPKALKTSPLLEQYGGSWINKNRATIWPCNPTPGHISREKQGQIGYMHHQCLLQPYLQ